MEFGEWLRTEAAARRLSQRHLGAVSGVHHTTISRLISNPDHRPSLATATALRRALGAPTDGDPREERPVDPAVRLENALRRDANLTDAEVVEIMDFYWRTRRGPRPPAPAKERAARSRRPAEGMIDPVVAVVLRAP